MRTNITQVNLFGFTSQYISSTLDEKIMLFRNLLKHIGKSGSLMQSKDDDSWKTHIEHVHAICQVGGTGTNARKGVYNNLMKPTLAILKKGQAGVNGCEVFDYCNKDTNNPFKRFVINYFMSYNGNDINFNKVGEGHKKFEGVVNELFYTRNTCDASWFIRRVNKYTGFKEWVALGLIIRDQDFLSQLKSIDNLDKFKDKLKEKLIIRDQCA